MEEKDRRYKTVNRLIKGGHLDTFKEIFDTLPKSVMAGDLGKHNVAFTRLINNTQLLRVLDISKIAALLDIEERVLLDLILKQQKGDRKDR